MVFRFFEGKGGAQLASVASKVEEMLALDRRELEMAMSALLGDAEPGAVEGEVRSADRRVNGLEREIRRQLVVHASVFGGIDSPAVLVHMSTVKDIERIGDYAKNLLDLALEGARFGELPDAAEWRALAGEVPRLVVEAGAAFRSSDGTRCREHLERGEQLLRHFDRRVSSLVRGDDSGGQAVARALAYRYLKRIVAHLMNLLSSVVLPLDRLDAYDEDPEDRELG